MSTLTVNPKSALAVSVRHLLASHPFVTFFVLTQWRRHHDQP